MASVKKNDKDYLVYKGRPLIRSGNVLYYGDMKDEYIVMLQILGTAPSHGLDIANRVMITLMRTDESLNPLERIVKTGEKPGIYSAMDVASVWLERALTAKQ